MPAGGSNIDRPAVPADPGITAAAAVGLHRVFAEPAALIGLEHQIRSTHRGAGQQRRVRTHIRQIILKQNRAFQLRHGDRIVRRHGISDDTGEKRIGDARTRARIFCLDLADMPLEHQNFDRSVPQLLLRQVGTGDEKTAVAIQF